MSAFETRTEIEANVLERKTLYHITRLLYFSACNMPPGLVALILRAAPRSISSAQLVCM